MGRTTHVDMNQQVEEIQIEQAEESIDSNPTEMIQLVCAGCMRPFESENHFQAHICTGQATLVSLSFTLHFYLFITLFGEREKQK